MLWFVFISTILALAFAQGEDNCPSYKYNTVNTFRTEKSFSFSCYGVDANCKVYYAPPGSGCNGDLLKLIGNLPANETTVLTFDEGFELGGRFCSNYQIGVYYVDKDTGDITTHLPRATEAGTTFNSVLFGADSGVVNDCVFSALSSGANVRLNIGGRVILQRVDSYGFNTFNTPSIRGFTPEILKPISFLVDSDNPVIVSCARAGSNRSVTLQPVSQEPLVLNAGPSDTVSITLSDCRTNAYVQNYSKANFGNFNEAGMPCNVAEGPYGSRLMEDCIFFIQSFENVCAGMSLYRADDAVLVATGMPESRFSTRFVNYPEVEGVNLISFSNTPCTGFGPSNELQALIPDWVTVDLRQNVSFGNPNPIAGLSWTECENPVLLVSRKNSARVPFLSGYQSEELWQPYFDSICPTQPPSTSNARSQVTSWVVFFAVCLFSSSLLV